MANTHIIYIIRNAPPPLFPASVGKRQMFPKPTAEPAATSIAPILLPKLLLCFIFNMLR